MPTPYSDDHIQSCLHRIRGHLVVLQTDLARFYHVPARRLLACAEGFPGDFCFPLEYSEMVDLAEDGQDCRQRLHAFSEHGALLVAFAINTPESVATGIQVARAFVRFRQQSMTAPTLAFAGS